MQVNFTLISSLSDQDDGSASGLETLVSLRRYVGMSLPVYIDIPDTTDRAYWQLKAEDAIHSLQVFVPIYPELHRQLKAEARKASQTRLANKVKPLPPLDVEQSGHF